ncbi:MAG: hypothetical protein WD042_08235 [Phycisphaeraceae bacterium]
MLIRWERHILSRLRASTFSPILLGIAFMVCSAAPSLVRAIEQVTARPHDVGTTADEQKTRPEDGADTSIPDRIVPIPGTNKVRLETNVLHAPDSLDFVPFSNRVASQPSNWADVIPGDYTGYPVAVYGDTSAILVTKVFDSTIHASGGFPLWLEGNLTGSTGGSGGAVHWAVQVAGVEIERIWSDQWGNNGEVNYVPDGYGQGDNTGKLDYILVGPQVGGTFSVKARFRQALGSTLVRLGRVNANGQPSAIFGTGTTSDRVATMTHNGTISQEPCRVLAGADTNGNGQLETSEVTMVSPWRVICIDSASWVTEVAWLNAYVTVGGLAYPYANDACKAFLYGQQPGYASSQAQITIIASDADIEHRVGLAWNAAGSAPAKQYEYPNGGDVAYDTLQSVTVTKVLTGVIKSHGNDIEQWDVNNPNQQLKSFWWEVPAQFVEYDDESGIPFMEKTSDLWFLWGKARMSGHIRVEIERGWVGGLIATGVYFTGPHSDLYDFSYEQDGLAHSASIVQTGYSTLNTAGYSGQVYRNIINYWNNEAPEAEGHPW